MEGNFLTRWTFLRRVSQVWDIYSYSKLYSPCKKI